MEILGIGPGEFLLILIVLLVVVGPERLPDLARQAGKLVVRARNWIQSSPDAALVLRARQEIEQELAGLKASLLEVQSVRDEVLGAARQIEDSVGSLASTKLDLDDVGTIAPPKPAAPPLLVPDSRAVPSGGAGSPPPPDEIAQVAADPGETLVETTADSAAIDLPPRGQPAPAYHANGAGPTAAPAPAPAELDQIARRLDAIMADLNALQQQLQQRGALAPEWTPPSWSMSLPDTPDVQAAGHAQTTGPAETEEAT